jgi:hypothetical protein
MIDLTPPQYRCAISAACPSVHRIVIDGKRHLIVVGSDLAFADGDYYNQIFRDLLKAKKIGRYESAILIEEDLLSGIGSGCQANAAETGHGSAPQAAFQSGPEWMPIETAPMEGQPVDLWITPPSGALTHGPCRLTDCWHSAGKWWRYDDVHGDDLCRSEVHNATHWMRLPLSPQAAFHSNGSAEADPRCNVCGQQLHMGCCNPGRSVNYAALTGSARSGPIEEAGTADERTAETADASLTSKICNCHLHSHQVCDICAGGMPSEATGEPHSRETENSGIVEPENENASPERS